MPRLDVAPAGAVPVFGSRAGRYPGSPALRTATSWLGPPTANRPQRCLPTIGRAIGSGTLKIPSPTRLGAPRSWNVRGPESWPELNGFAATVPQYTPVPGTRSAGSGV